MSRHARGRARRIGRRCRARRAGASADAAGRARRSPSSRAGCGSCASAAGEWTRARTIATDLLAERGIGPLRAEALVLLAELEGLDRAVALLEEALREAASRPALQVRHPVPARVGDPLHEGVRGSPRARPCGARDRRRARRRRAPHRRARASSRFSAAPSATRGAGARRASTRLASAARRRAAAAGGDAGDRNMLDVRRSVDEARALLSASTRSGGSATSWRPRALMVLAWVELWAGRWSSRPTTPSAPTSSRPVRARGAVDHVPIAVIAAHRGQLEIARAHSERALRLGRSRSGCTPPVHLAIARVRRPRGRRPARGARLVRQGRGGDGQARLGWGEPSNRWWVPDHVEALLELGRLDDAVRIIDAWEADARRLGRAWVLAHVDALPRARRGRPGDGPGRVAPRARGRRSTRRPATRSAGPGRCSRSASSAGASARSAPPATRSSAALAAFEQLGAATWIERAGPSSAGSAGEHASGGSRRRSAASPRSSPRAGRTARSPPRCSSASDGRQPLTHVYAKLGVRSRTELARRLLRRLGRARIRGTHVSS